MSAMKRTTALLLLAAAVAAEAVEAEKGTLRVSVAIDGKFVPAGPPRLELDCEQYDGPFVVEHVAGHGTWVNEGDVVVRFDKEAYERQLQDRAMALERAETGHRHYLAQARLDREKRERGLAQAERDAARAQKRLKGYREIEKEIRDERERQQKQSREFSMENQKDELTQLEKMYAEDELVDATEEIVLKRARRRYAQAVAREELNERNRKYNKEWYEHWTEENYVADAEEKQAKLEAARAKAAMAEESARHDLAKRERDLAEARRRFEEFRKDGEKLVMRAPHRGLFMHEGGRWEKGAEFRKGARVATVMAPGDLVLEGWVPEKEILRIEPGLAVAVEPAAMEETELDGRLKLDYLPSPKGQFKAKVEFEKLPTGLRPGMSAKARIILQEVRDAVLVPKGAVKEGKVWVLEGEEGEWREVVTGPDDGEKIVIRDGLSAGEKVEPAPK